MKAEDVDAAGPKVFGHAFQMPARRLFGQQMAEAVEVQ